MKILVVGGGGREHAIIKKLKENKTIEQIFALPGNGGIAADATCVNIAATEGYIESLQKRYYRGLYADWAIELKNEKKMIGTIGYANINSKEKSCEIGYVLSPKYRKQGYMSEALSALLQLTFESLKFDKAILRIIDENSDSVKLAEKMGFTVETSIEIPIKGQLKNVLYYTKTKNEAVV